MPDQAELDKLENDRIELEKKMMEQDKSHKKDMKTWKLNIKT